MVELTDYELNHIETIDMSNGVIAIGANTDTENEELELFQKSLALTSDLKRLPILRGGHMMISISPSTAELMEAAGINALRAVLSLHNASEENANANNRIGACSVLICQDNFKTTVVDKEDWVWDFEGGVLLNPKMTARVFMDTNVNVAGAALPLGLISMAAELEIDWAKVTKKVFEEFILESVYADGLNDD